MQRSPVRSGRGSLRLVRAAALAALTALAGAGLAGCSSSRPVPATGTTGLAGTVSPTLGVAVSTSEVVSAENLPVQKALSVLRELFVRSGVDPDDQHSAGLRLGSCPLGRTQELTATPPAPVPALDTSAIVTLNRSRGPVLDVICRFSNNASADVTSPAQGDRTSSEVQYDASYVSPSQLKAYLRYLDDRGFVQRPERFIDGVIYASCAASESPATSAGAKSSDCSALWYFRQLVVGVQFAGPGEPVDVTTWLTRIVQPIVQSLATTDPAAIAAATTTAASASTTTA